MRLAFYIIYHSATNGHSFIIIHLLFTACTLKIAAGCSVKTLAFRQKKAGLFEIRSIVWSDFGCSLIVVQNGYRTTKR